MMAPVIAGLAVGTLFIFMLSMAVEVMPARYEVQAIIGKVVCLPPEPGLDHILDVCTGGFYDTDNKKYYWLDLDIEHRWLHATLDSDETFIVTGTIKPVKSVNLEEYRADLDRYDVAGVIADVTLISTLDGSTSEYETGYRLYRQLSPVLDEIGRAYSMVLDECDSEPCVKIVIRIDEEELELIDKFPEELEGYKVDVEVEILER